MKYLQLLLLLLAGTTATARDWYLSPLGDDAGDGSVAQPLRSIAALLDPAADRVRAGDRLVLRGPAANPVFRETEVRLRVPLTMMAFAGEQPRIECPLDLADGVCIQIDPAASGSIISGLDIAGGNLYAIFLQSDWDSRSAPDGQGASNVLIEHSRIHDSGRDAIKLTPKSNNVTIRHCEIYNTGRIYPPGTPLEQRNAEGIDNVQGHGMVVQDNHIHDISTNGVYFKGGAMDALVERNLIERVGEAGILAGFDTSPEFFDLRQNPTYHEAIRGIVRNNVVRATEFAGIGLYASRDVLVAHNTLVDVARQGQAALYFGVTLQDFDPAAGRPPNLAPRLLNNLLVQPGVACIGIRHANELGGLAGLQGAPGSDANLFSSATGCRFFDQRPGSALAAGGSLAQWQAVLAADARSLEVAASVDARGRLPAGSPAIDRGVAVAEVSDDIDRQPRTAPFDLGADEFAAGSVGPGTAAASISGWHSGSWFDPGRRGEGFVLEVGQGNDGSRSLVVSWYTYRDGQPLWLFGSTVLPSAASSASLTLFSGRGARFGSAFRAADVVLDSWGTVELSFTGCAALAVRYAEAGGESGSLQLQRILQQIDGLPCR